MTWKAPKYESYKRRKDFTLDLTNNPKSHVESYTFTNNCKYKVNKKELKPSPSNDSVKTNEKTKRSKSRMRSPMQNHKKSLHVKKTLYESNYQVEKENKITSDESSCDIGVKHISNQNSPRKNKKNKENTRRKSLPKSPVSQRSANKIDLDDKPASLPGSLNRRKSSKQTANSLLPDNAGSKRYR